MDNLDKSWKDNSDIDFQCRWLLSLLGVTGRIIRDFAGDSKNQSSVEFHLTIFLRSDIFKYVMQTAREPDKIEYTKLIVEDKETLYRIIEERFCILNGNVTPDDLWKKYLVTEVNGESSKDYIYKRIIPRPRDMIFFFNKLKEIAVRRGHKGFLEVDIVDAYKQYSEWVFSSLIVENGVSVKQMEAFLYELVGTPIIINKTKILEYAPCVRIVVA